MLSLIIVLLVPSIGIVNQTHYNPSTIASASDEEFNEIIDEQLGNLDTSDIDEILDGIDEQSKEIFGDNSFLDKLSQILSGDLGADAGSILQYVLSLVFDNILSFLPIISIIISIAILGSMIHGLKPNANVKSISSIINFVVYSVIVVLIFSVLGGLISSVVSSIDGIKAQMDAIFPILLTLLTSIGGTVSVGVYQPAMAVLSSVVVNIFTIFLLPLFILSSVLVLVNNMSNSIKLDKMIGFINSLFKWVVSIVFTVFLGFASLQGLTAGSIDGLSIKTAKFTLKSYIPIVGGYMSDGIYLILAGCNLIKNAVGVAGLLLMFSSLIAPLLEIIVFMLVLKLVSAIVEPLGNSKVANLVSGLAKNMKMLVAMVVSISFMYILIMGLVMCSANII